MERPGDAVVKEDLSADVNTIEVEGRERSGTPKRETEVISAVSRNDYIGSFPGTTSASYQRQPYFAATETNIPDATSDSCVIQPHRQIGSAWTFAQAPFDDVHRAGAVQQFVCGMAECDLAESSVFGKDCNDNFVAVEGVELTASDMLEDAVEEKSSLLHSGVADLTDEHDRLGNDCLVAPVDHCNLFCTVPGRLSLLSAAKKYPVTVDEVRRRIMPPECLNASILGAILRKAKAKDGGKTLRASLDGVGVSLPAGQRRTRPITSFTALVEGEAQQAASDLDVLCDRHFDARCVAEQACQKHELREDIESQFRALEYAIAIVSSVKEVVENDHNAVCGNVPAPVLPPELQGRLTEFSLLTHSFGSPAIATMSGTVLSVLREMVDVYRQKLNQFDRTSEGSDAKGLDMNDTI